MIASLPALVTCAGKPASKAVSAAKRRQPKPTPEPSPAVVAQGSFSRKRPLAGGSQQPAAVRIVQPAAAAAAVQQRPSKQPRPTAEALFDSLFDEEQENGAAAVAPPAPAPRKPAAAVAAVAPEPARSGGSESDLAAKVQARLQKHRARFSRRRSASQRQLEDEE